MKILNYLTSVLENLPSDWLYTTTHRLDIYNERLAKKEFLEQFNELYNNKNSSKSILKKLPTAYDYIRLGHPLSCILEWTIANLFNTKSQNVISFSSQTIPLLAILRANLLDNKKTQIIYSESLPPTFDEYTIREVYGYEFELVNTDKLSKIPDFEGTTISIIQNDKSENHLKDLDSDFIIKTYLNLGSILIVNNETNNHYISKIQHVRRRETIAMTPINCHLILKSLVNNSNLSLSNVDQINKTTVQGLISNITKTKSKPIVGSSGLSIQYAIMMGLIEDAKENYREKTIKFIVPPNCYGGTNDQARRVADCIKNVEIVDLPVDRNNDMVKSIDTILDTIAYEDAVPYIIAEIPTNPRVEVPDLQSLKTVLEKKRTTASGTKANDAVFILDQTFCPNVHFFGDDEVLSSVRAISYASGSKFPSGGLCTAGYCVGNEMTISLLSKIEKHLLLCDNEATAEQYKILANQLPSMNNRIDEAYQNTRDFVNFISKTLPGAKINFVTDDLASLSFKPSVFSLDLPTKGVTDEEREIYKRKLNLRLINLMISQIPNESKFCVSYGQLKGSYWTIPATSTQGTTKEGDKDYIVRVSIAPSINIELHKKVFMEFVAEI